MDSRNFFSRAYGNEARIGNGKGYVKSPVIHFLKP